MKNQSNLMFYLKNMIKIGQKIPKFVPEIKEY